MRPARSRHAYTLTDYLLVEEESLVKHELLDGEILAMAGGTPEHAALSAAVIAALANALATSPCRVFSSDLRVRVRETGLVTYPDAAVVCGPIARDPETATCVNNPALIVEVLSPGTRLYDLGEKLAHYQQIQTLRVVLHVDSERRRIDRHQRGDDAAWSAASFGAGAVVPVVLGAGEPPVALDVDGLYDAAGVALP
jgi:Uma2 family endonuclease